MITTDIDTVTASADAPTQASNVSMVGVAAIDWEEDITEEAFSEFLESLRLKVEPTEQVKPAFAPVATATVRARVVEPVPEPIRRKRFNVMSLDVNVERKAKREKALGHSATAVDDGSDVEEVVDESDEEEAVTHGRPQKFGELQGKALWIATEKKLPAQVQQILEVIIDLSTGETSAVEYGTYVPFIDVLREAGLTVRFGGSFGSGGPSKKEKIVAENIKRINKCKLDELKLALASSRNTSMASAKTVVEQVIFLMVQIKHLLDGKHHDNSDEYSQLLYVTACRACEILGSVKNEDVRDVIADLDVMSRALQRAKGFSVENIPEDMILNRAYPGPFPKFSATKFKRHDWQDELVKSLEKSEPQTIELRATVGAGKTISVVLAADAARKAEKVLFVTCGVRSVIVSMCQYFNAANIPWAFVRHDGKGNSCIKPSFVCRGADPCVVVGFPVDVTRLLEKMAKEHPEQMMHTMLFCDEPTIGADGDDNTDLEQTISCLMVAPATTILSSATLPPIDSLVQLKEQLVTRYPTMFFKEITSSDIPIAATMRLFDGSSVYPHEGHTTVDDLTHLRSAIIQNPFVGRFVTVRCVRDLVTRMVECGIETPRLDEFFANVMALIPSTLKKFYCDLWTC